MFGDPISDANVNEDDDDDNEILWGGDYHNPEHDYDDTRTISDDDHDHEHDHDTEPELLAGDGERQDDDSPASPHTSNDVSSDDYNRSERRRTAGTHICVKTLIDRPSLWTRMPTPPLTI